MVKMNSDQVILFCRIIINSYKNEKNIVFNSANCHIDG